MLLLGDSHVRRVEEPNLHSSCFIATGIGGLKSDQLISKHRGIINSHLDKVDEVILHVGSNDISKGVKQERIIESMDMVCAKPKEINPKISTARKTGNISHILKVFFDRHSSEYETSDSDRKVIQNLYSQMRIHMVR